MMKGRELDTGMILGRYRLEKRIGEGGMGSVWRARDELLERDVALKALPSMLVTDSSAQRRFEREARAMGRLQHPNVVGIYDIGTADPGIGEDLPFLVLELVHGRPLNELIPAGPTLRQSLRWMEQVARALASAHSAGIVHRDLKPSNIMVDPEDHVVVLDFGLARLTRREGEVPEESLTTPGMVLGSCPYMAPEQALGQGVTVQSDIFSLGSVFFEVLTGERAFKGDTPMRVLQAVVRSAATPLEDLAPGLPPAVYEIVDRCMEREPANRYPTAGELARDLATVAEIEASSPSSATTLIPRSGTVVASKLRRARRRRILATVAAAAVVIGGLVGLWFGRWGWEPTRPDPGRWSMTELLQGSGDFYRPNWSSDARLVAIGRADGERGEVLVVPSDGGQARTLVEGGGHRVPGHPCFSPDAAAVVVSVLTGESQSLEVVPTVGGPPVIEVENAFNGVWVDRTTLLFTRVVDGRSSIWSIDIETGAEEELFEARDGVSWWEVLPRPGGGYVLLGGATDTNLGIYVADESRETLKEWFPPGRLVHGVDWTPDGSALVASVDGQIVAISVDGVRPLLPDDQEAFRFPAFSDGGRLAAVQTNRSYDLVSVDPDGGPWECLLCSVSNAGWGSVGYEGAVVYRLQQGEKNRVYIRESGGVPRVLTDTDEEASCPVLSPDSQRVAYLAQADGTVELRVRPREGGEPVVLARDLENSEFVSWSPDGGRIAYAGGSPLRVWVVSIAGGEPTPVTDVGGDYPSWSPDGSLIAFSIWTEETDPDQGTWVVAADGGEPRKLSDLPTRVAWDLQTGELLQLRRMRESDTIELWATDPETSRWSRRSRLDLGVRPGVHFEFLPFTVDPGSGRLVMNRRSATGRLVVFDGIEFDRW